jgi:amino acid transporter
MEISERPVLTRFVVPVTIMLSFVSFWRAAALVLTDLGSSAYYVGGIAEHAIGKAAPWFILAIMLFSYAMRAVYVESCSMFVRGGVYRVVREAMGGTAAKFSVSALMFDYILTGPISAVSAGLYLAGLINESGQHFDLSWMKVPPALFAAGFAILVTIYFWHSNRVGIRFTSTRALRIMQITSVMVVVLIVWCLITILQKGYQPVPLPKPQNLHFTPEAVGWLKGTVAPEITVIAIMIGLGHSLLAMSGEESLAQVNREIEAPKHKNLVRAGLVIFVFSLAFTSLVSFFAVMIIPDSERPKYFDNLISGLSLFLAGPFGVKLAFHAFVVVVGTLILSGAVNTAIMGSNGVLNRVAEDGVLPAWFRKPHKKYGTTHRIINLIVTLQIIAIVISRGNVFMLGEAYAFGVAWSFAMKALAVSVLRFTKPDAERWRVPFNIRVRRVEIPMGLILITAVLFMLAIVNVLTKKTATISGTAFTLIFFAAFTVSERYYGPTQRNGARRLPGGIEEIETERFRLEIREDLSPNSLHIRPGNVVVAVHNPHNVSHLGRVLEQTDPSQSDVVVISVNCNPPDDDSNPGQEAEHVVGDFETQVFSNVVYAAEKVGKPVSLIAVCGSDPYGLILLAALKLVSSRVVIGPSASVCPGEQEQEIEEAWERLAGPKPAMTLEIIEDHDEARLRINLKAHDSSLG